MMKALLFRLSMFRRDRRGAVAVLIAVAIVPLIAMIGVATDSARGFYARSRLSSAVDAAALAGGQVYFENRRASDARQFFDANFPPGFMGSNLIRWEVDPPAGVAPSGTDRVFTVRASAEIPTTFMRIFGHQTMTVSSYAEVTRESKALDVVLAIDMSGSMLNAVDGGAANWGKKSRLELAKEAAKEMVGILFGDNASSDLLRVAIVPWAGMVNVTDAGTSYGYDSMGNVLAEADRVWDVPVPTFRNLHVRNTSIGPNYKSPEGGQNNRNRIYFAHNSAVPLLTPPIFAPGTNNPVETWNGCVWARWESGLSDNKSDDYTADRYNGLTERWPGWSPMGPDVYPIAQHKVTRSGWFEECTGWGQNRTCRWVYREWEETVNPRCAASSGSECTPCPASGITRLQNSKQAALDAIDALIIPPSEQQPYTNIPQGLVWAWRVVSPEAPFVESSIYQPGYEPSRAIVLLTDGANTRTWGDAYNNGLSNRDQRLRDIADNIKAVDKNGDGQPDYEIYTILFAKDDDTNLKNLMKYVASEPNSPYYYNAPTSENLTAAFNQIGNHLSNLRLSK